MTSSATPAPRSGPASLFWRRADQTQSLTALVADMAANAVDTLVTIDCNPAYASAGALDFAKRLALVRNRIHVGLHSDETAQLCQWHLPLSHPLESFGDARAIDGSASIIQPVIAPLYSSRSVHQFVDMLSGSTDPAADGAVRATWQATFGGDFEQRWVRALHDGFVADSAAKPLTLAAKASPPPVANTASAAGDIDIVFGADPTIWDGRFANIAWLQELPKPLTKITWDNVIAVSPAIAAAQDEQDTLIAGGRVYLPGGDPHDPPVRDILVQNGRITSVDAPDSQAATKAEVRRRAAAGEARVIDAENLLMLPGFVNAHYHSYDVLQKACWRTCRSTSGRCTRSRHILGRAARGLQQPPRLPRSTMAMVSPELLAATELSMTSPYSSGAPGFCSTTDPQRIPRDRCIEPSRHTCSHVKSLLMSS